MTHWFKKLQEQYDDGVIRGRQEVYLDVAREVKLLAQEYKEHGLEREAATAFCIYHVLAARVSTEPLPELKEHCGPFTSQAKEP